LRLAALCTSAQISGKLWLQLPALYTVVLWRSIFISKEKFFQQRDWLLLAWAADLA
jgi:hypothetical protein